MILYMQGEAKNEGMSQRIDAGSSSLLPSTAIKAWCRPLRTRCVRQYRHQRFM